MAAEYDCDRYFKAIGSMPLRICAPFVSPGIIANLAELEYQKQIRSRVEEAMQKKWWQDVNGGLHSNPARALDASNALHLAWGLQDCTGDNWGK